MKKLQYSHLYLLVIILSLTSLSVNAAPITLNSGGLLREVIRQDGLDQVSAIAPTLSLNTTNTMANATGPTFSSSTHNFTSDATSANFNINISQLRKGSFIGNIARSRGTIIFTPTTDVVYQVSGNYQVSGDQRAFLQVFIQGTTTLPFNNFQDSRTTLNESYVIGQQGGDFSNTLTGSISGILTAGTQYSFVYDAFIQEFPNLGVNTSATGTINLNLQAVVPELSTSYSLAFALLLACFTISRKK